MNVETETSTVFREAKPVRVETPQEPIEPTIETDRDNNFEGDELPINLYREDGRAPYFLSLIEGGDFAHKTFNVEELSADIDDYLLREGTDKETYEKGLKELIKQTKAEGDVYTIVDKLHAFVRIQNKLLEALRERKEFEAKDPEDMNSKELERYING